MERAACGYVETLGACVRRDDEVPTGSEGVPVSVR